MKATGQTQRQVWGGRQRGRQVRLSFTYAILHSQFPVQIKANAYKEAQKQTLAGKQMERQTDNARQMQNGHRKMAAEGNYDINKKWMERPDRWWGRRMERHAGRSHRQTVLKSLWVQNMRPDLNEIQCSWMWIGTNLPKKIWGTQPTDCVESLVCEP